MGRDPRHLQRHRLLQALACEADAGRYPAWIAIVTGTRCAAFLRLQGVGLHHLSPRPGHLVISFQMPFPDSHTSQDARPQRGEPDVPTLVG